MLAPAVKAGANTPPAAPLVNDNIGPTIRISGIYQGKCLSAVNKACVIISLPEPNDLSLTKDASVASTRAQAVMYKTLLGIDFRDRVHVMIDNIIRAILLPSKPVTMPTAITPKKI